jgi:hypothetical protein
MEGLDLGTLKGRLAYAIKTRGPKFVSEKTGISISQMNSLSGQKVSTTLEKAAEISIATGFELKWIALGTGEMMANIDPEDEQVGVRLLDEEQDLQVTFGPKFFDQQIAVTHENCFAWEVDYKISLEKLERGCLTLVNIEDKKGSGLFVMDINDRFQVVYIHANLDGSATIKTDDSKPDTYQTLSKDQLDDLEIIGRIFWHGGQV